MSWCTIVDKVTRINDDVEHIFKRIGGRVNVNDLDELEPFTTMSEVKVSHIFLCVDNNKVIER
jgi:hypothetical protein